MIKLWGHECTRVFHDRLSTVDDREWFFGNLARKVKKHFKREWTSLSPEGTPLMFGKFVDPKVPIEKQMYQEVMDLDGITDVMNDYLEDYNNMSNNKMNLVLFMNAIEHVARVARVIAQPLGNALLVGVGGSGRKSLTLLAASLSEMKVFQIEISKVYGMFEWHEDLKKLLQMAGVKGSQTVFLFSDTQIVNEGFVEDINNILNTGEVPNLFLTEERQAIVEEVRAVGEKQGREMNSTADVLEFFVERCRSNLHIVLAFSPIGDAFRNRLRQFPSLVNCCAIDWYMEWPEEALQSVASHFLSKVDLSDRLKKGVGDICVQMQQTASTMTHTFFEGSGAILLRYSHIIFRTHQYVQETHFYKADRDHDEKVKV